MDEVVASYLDRPDEELYEALGASLLGSGLGVSPVDRDRFRQFARNWFDNKLRQLRVRIHASETYRVWTESGDRSEAAADLIARVLREQGYDGEIAARVAVLLDRTDRRDALASVDEDYDIAVSFAAEQRPYVESTVVAAKALGVRVFYDRDMVFEWWGRNYITEQRKVYARGALFFVPFLSEDYLANPVPRDEYAHAMLRAVERGEHYILPVLIGAVTVPSELLHPYIGYLRAEDHTPSQLAAMMHGKVDQARSTTTQP